MIRFLRFNDPEFHAAFAQIVARGEGVSAEVEATVKAIIAEVRERGDAAVCDYTARFDRLQLTAATMQVTAAEIDSAMAAVDPQAMADLQLAAERIVDLVSTGGTLRDNGLVEVETICEVTSRLIVNRASLKTKHRRIAAIIAGLEQVIEAAPRISS